MNSQNSRHNLHPKYKSLYYEILLKQEGEKKADLYWERRNTLSAILMFNSMDCEKINRLCDNFIKKHELKWQKS